MLLLSAFSVLALLFAVFVEAQVGAVKCGNRWFTGDQLQKTLNEACRLLQSSRQAGTYPHRYKNYEGFDFGAARPPYFEFPMFTSSIYQGGRLFLAISALFWRVANSVTLSRPPRRRPHCHDPELRAGRPRHPSPKQSRQLCRMLRYHDGA